MVFGILFAFWRFMEIITLVRPHPLRSICAISNTTTDPNPRHARLLRKHLQQGKPPHPKLHPNPLHRLRPRRRLGHRNTLHLPPRALQRPLRLLHRSLLRRSIYRRSLRIARDYKLQLHKRQQGVGSFLQHWCW